MERPCRNCAELVPAYFAELAPVLSLLSRAGRKCSIRVTTVGLNWNTFGLFSRRLDAHNCAELIQCDSLELVIDRQTAFRHEHGSKQRKLAIVGDNLRAIFVTKPLLVARKRRQINHLAVS